MATYKEIHGIKVQYRDSDAPEIEGDVWYNSSTGKLRMYASVGSWASGGNYPASLREGGSAGTQTAGLVAGGNAPPNTRVAVVEGYDGTTWSTRPSISTARDGTAGSPAGTATTALLATGDAGGYQVATEEFTGETTSLNLKTITDS